MRDGTLHEKIYEVAFAGIHKPDPGSGNLAPIGSTVSLKDATYTNNIGAPSLAVAWTDPDFDPAISAFSYVRALENPNPRWTLYDAVRFKEAPAQGRAAGHPGTDLQLTELA